MTIATELTTLAATKTAIKTAIEAKGQNLTDVNFAGYATAIDAIETGGSSGGSSTEWTEAYWQAIQDAAVASIPVEYELPETTDTDQVIYGKVKVAPDTFNNFVAFSVTTSTGDYQVDWGDGTVETFTSGVTAQHDYSYSNTSLTDTTLGFKVGLVTVTAVSGNLTGVDFQKVPSQYASSTSYDYCSLWLSLSVCGASITTLVVGASSDYAKHSNLLSFESRKNAVTNMSNMFYFCYSLTTIPLLDTSNVTNIYNMFYNCYSLTTIPLLDTSSVTNMSNMFYYCYSLITLPLLDTSSVTNMSNMFYYCYSLTTIPPLDTSNVTVMGNIFNNCYSIQRCQAPIKSTVSLANGKLSANALNEIYSNLPVVTGQTLTVTGNWGTANDDPSIATAKGWTITG